MVFPNRHQDGLNMILSTFNHKVKYLSKVQINSVNAWKVCTSKRTLKLIRTHIIMWKGTPTCRVARNKSSSSLIRLMQCMKPSTSHNVMRDFKLLFQNLHPFLGTRTLVMFKCLAHLLILNVLLFSKVFIFLLGIY